MAKKKNRTPLDTHNQYVLDLDADKPIESLEIPIWERLFNAFVIIIAFALVVAMLYAVSLLITFLLPQNREVDNLEAGTTLSTEATPESEEASTESDEVTEESMDQACQVTIRMELNGETMEEGEEYQVSSLEDWIDVYAQSSEADIDRIVWTIMDMNDESTEDWTGKGAHVGFNLPKRKAGTVSALIIEAIAENDDGSDNTITRAITGCWLVFD